MRNVVVNYLRRKESCFGRTALMFLCLFQSAQGAVKERVYTMGDNDAGAVVGQPPPLAGAPLRHTTNDIQPSTTDLRGFDPPNDVNQSFVPLKGFNVNLSPKYALANDRPGAASGNLALEWDGVNDNMFSDPFDPRDFLPGDGPFDTLSQAWVKPTSASFTGDQFVYRVGRENGGVLIKPGGNWALRTGDTAVPPDVFEVTSSLTATPNVWAHVAVFRGGTTSLLYINGSIAAVDTGFWNMEGPEVTLGATTFGTGSFFKGLIDNFALSGLSDEAFNEATDIDYFADTGITFSGIAGDVNQDGNVNNADYNTWSTNFGFNNNFGFGDPTTLLLGDVDGSGDVDLFDFRIIQQEALAAGTPLTFDTIPEPGSAILLMTAGALLLCGRRNVQCVKSLKLKAIALSVVAVIGLNATSARAVVVVAEDFLYDGPSKTLHIGGGFNGDLRYAGGQNGTAGQWTSLWGQVGDGIITTPAYVPPEPEPNTPTNVALYDAFFGVQSELLRDFELDASVSPTQTLYFGGRFKADLFIGTDGQTVPQFYAPRLFLNRVEGDDRYYDINGIILPAQRDRTLDIALGFESFKNINTQTTQNMVVARLGGGTEAKATVVGAPPSDGNWHSIVGKLELNISGGANERLTVWFDPSGVESGGTSVQLQADVLADLTALIGTYHSQGTRPLNTTNDPMLPIDPNDSVIELPAEVGRSYIDDMVIGTTWQDVATVEVPRLTLRIDPTSGIGRLINLTDTVFDLDGYSIESAAGSLNPTGWNSLDEQNVDTWVQNEATGNQLVETNFLDATTIAAGGQLPLGTLWNVGGSQQIVGRYSTQDGLINVLNVEFSSAGLAGDFDNDGDVDGRDFLRWQRGQSPNPLSASDLAAWQANYGAPGLAATTSAVPEPNVAVMLCWGLAGLFSLRRAVL
jgi:hypothetical protein